ncbi:hypothetical protein MN116_006663 [Schistosoma mekongi]|uniref:C2H2-type domain-containing protein n=1 Tax=Schistosoma mekongi TaxID=38744 RepID=A0AAE2D2T7_SCHME|nr:hypothetical protein MN116_006663 [Schistosoma mekongi]
MLSRPTGFEESGVYSLTVDSLKQGRVVGQFDRKFILMVVESENDQQMFEEPYPNSQLHGYKHLYIFAVDQHAAHERVLLECYERECLNYFEILSNRATHETLHSRKTSLIICRQSFADVSDLIKHGQHSLNRLSEFGFLAYVNYSSTEQAIHVTKIPKVIPQNGISEKLLKRAIIDCIRVILLNKESKIKIIQNIMQVILPLLKTRACHQAVRFGSKLDTKQMEKLIVELSKCRIPFQCAHGRPTCNLIKIVNEEVN